MAKSPKVKKSNSRKAEAPKTRVTWSENSVAFLAKLGETQIEVKVERGDRVVDVLKKGQFPEGVIKGESGQSITNLYDAAERMVSQGTIRSVDQAFSDIRVNATPATLNTEVAPDDVITLIPKIKGGSN